ncbi:chorismate synthase [Ophiocordyceps camponoti-floridani]|uniref:chorismate synthase n=1 Tax=Ophiocordyceps camponoti-floridani TaxID=2030778 RepID=A0A8H4VEI8_9HYPO|nr:chorismate synthase [Ophiocordyceps camponoti-floridani]
MSTFGRFFLVHTAGESHGKSMGCIIENCPPGLTLSESDIQPQLNRRRPGQSAITTPRDEKDRVTIHSGVEAGRTLGTPILLVVPNEDQRPGDYGGQTVDLYPRPGHADWTYLAKYGVKASSGGGRSSARETVSRVAAGAVAEKWLHQTYGMEIVAFVSCVGRIHLFPDIDGKLVSDRPEFADLIGSVTRDRVDEFLPVRCPNADVCRQMEDHISQARDQLDSIGGTVTCVVRNIPIGLGEPCFDKLEATLAQAMMSIPAANGFEIGGGFAATRLNGSQYNDPFIAAPQVDVNHQAGGIPRSILATSSNNSGGIQGGISNGMPVYFRVSFKPPSTIGQDQTTATYNGSEQGVLAAKGRHDPCVVPRAVPIVEAMAALAVADALMAQHARLAAP